MTYKLFSQKKLPVFPIFCVNAADLKATDSFCSLYCHLVTSTIEICHLSGP